MSDFGVVLVGFHDAGLAGAPVACESSGAVGALHGVEVVGGDLDEGGGDASGGGASGFELAASPEAGGGEFEARGSVDATVAVAPGRGQVEGGEVERGGVRGVGSMHGFEVRGWGEGEALHRKRWGR